MADRVLWQTGDDLTESNLAEAAGRSNASDYVERGLGFDVDYANNLVDVGSGLAIIRDGIGAYYAFADARTDLSLPASSGNNYVFITIEPATDDAISYHIDTDGTGPTTPALLIGVIDTANNTTDLRNRAPDISFNSAEGGSVDVDKLSLTESASRMFLSTDQSIPTGTETKIQLDGESYDKLNVVDTTNHKMTLPAGEYDISAILVYLGSANWTDGDIIIPRIKVGGSTEADPPDSAVGANGRQRGMISDTIELSTESDVEFYTFHASGSDETLEGTEARTYLTVSRSG